MRAFGYHPGMTVKKDDTDRQERAEARRSWPVRVHKLGEEPSDDISDCTTVEQRLAMVWELTKQAWELGGKPMPSYSRAELPIRMIKRKLPTSE